MFVFFYRRVEQERFCKEKEAALQTAKEVSRYDTLVLRVLILLVSSCERI